MANFVTGTAVETKEGVIEVTVSTEKPLAVGKHRFQLVVEDDGGNRSVPDIAEVYVKDQQNPTAVIEAPKLVEYGKSFTLGGTRSSDVPPGKVVKFVWTMLE